MAGEEVDLGAGVLGQGGGAGGGVGGEHGAGAGLGLVREADIAVTLQSCPSRQSNVTIF